MPGPERRDDGKQYEAVDHVTTRDANMQGMPRREPRQADLELRRPEP